MYQIFLSKSDRMLLSISINLPFFVICGTSEDNMQETMPQTFLRYESYSSKASFSKSANNLLVPMHKS